MNPVLVGSIALIVMVILLFLGMNIGLTFSIVGFIAYALIVSPQGASGLLRTQFYIAASNYSFCVIPLFILMGEFCFRSGMSSGLYDAASKWLNWLPGGLACANVVACAVFGAICGSVAATTATMGTVAMPEMRKKGYANTLSTGSVAAGGTLSVLIPPSTMFILYGISAEVSIGKLFSAGILPGIICAVIMCATIVLWVKKNPSAAPEKEHFSWHERLASLKGIIGIVILFVVVLGGMFSGLFTVNEASGIGAVMAAVIMAIRKQMTWKNLKASLFATIRTTGMVYLLLMGSNVMVSFLSVSNIPTALSTFVSTLNISKYVLITAIIILYVFLGCFMDGCSIILLTTPIFLPIALMLGFDAIWFGVIITLVTQIGAITPPVGLSCYVLSGVVKDIPLTTIFRGIVPFIFSLLITIFLLVVFPSMATWFPSMMA